jgi:hypothetical protein
MSSMAAVDMIPVVRDEVSSHVTTPVVPTEKTPLPGNASTDLT